MKNNKEKNNNEKDDNQRFSALIKLCLWAIFIVFVLLISNLGSKNVNNDTKNNNENEEVKEITYAEKLDNLKDNYKYNYEVKIDDKIYNFVGAKNLDKESGYRLYNEEYLYYFLENGMTYEVIDGTLKDLNNLYENIDSNYLNASMVKESILNKKYINDDNKYSYILEDNEIVYVYTNSENVEKIEVYLGEDYYKLEFSDIGLVGEIKY